MDFCFIFQDESSKSLGVQRLLGSRIVQMRTRVQHRFHTVRASSCASASIGAFASFSTTSYRKKSNSIHFHQFKESEERKNEDKIVEDARREQVPWHAWSRNLVQTGKNTTKSRWMKHAQNCQASESLRKKSKPHSNKKLSV